MKVMNVKKICEEMVCLECLHSDFTLVNYNTAGEPTCKCKNCGRAYTPTGYRVAVRRARGEVKCPSCGSVETKKNGRSTKGRQRWHCKECDHGWIEEGFERRAPSGLVRAERVKRFHLRKNLGEYWRLLVTATADEEEAYAAAEEIRRTAVAIASTRSGKSKTTERDTARAFEAWRRGSKPDIDPPDKMERRRRYDLRKKMGSLWAKVYEACGKNPEVAYEAARKIRSDAVARAGGKGVGEKEMSEAFKAWRAER